MKHFVKVLHGPDHAEKAYRAISAVCTHDVTGKQVLLKVNTGFKAEPRSGICTSPDVVEGVIRYFREKGAGRILVGDSSIVGVDSLEALASAGIRDVCEKTGVECVDLNSFDPVDKKIPGGIMVDSILFSSAPFESDIVVSMPVMKTHMYTGATLSIKNMKGCMYKREKTKLHRLSKPLPPDPRGRSLDYGLLDFTKVCYPDYAVVDGTVCMEGFGPSGGTPVNLDVVLAGSEPAAADLVALKLMGIPLEDVGHLLLISEARGVSYDTIETDPADCSPYSRKFVTAGEARLGLHSDKIVMEDESACSACHAALIQFLRYHQHDFEDGEVYTIFAGKDVNKDDILKAKNPCLVGNCTARFKDLAPFCRGCPPIPSEIKKTLKGEAGISITFLGHSCFRVRSKEYSILFDPFLTGNPAANVNADDVSATTILLTHGHGDHLGDTVSIARRCRSTVFATVETASLLPEEIKVEPGQIGGYIRTDFGGVKFLPAFHGSGVAGGLACGFLLEIEGKKIYFAGDTGLTVEMSLLAEDEIDVALLPIGDRFTMGSKDAVRAVSMIRPKKVIPMHYNTMPAIEQDPERFKEITERETGTECMILAVGESLSL